MGRRNVLGFVTCIGLATGVVQGYQRRPTPGVRTRTSGKLHSVAARD